MGEADSPFPKGLHRYSAQHIMRPKSVAHQQTLLGDWRQRHVLAQDELPAFYPYLQAFETYGERKPVQRIGFIAMVHLGETTVYPHEDVVERNVASRLPYLAATQLQAIPTHGLYDDPERLLERLVEDHLGYPLAEVVDRFGTRHTLGRITEKRLIQRVQDVMRERPIFQADGHHRMEAHRRYRAQYLQTHPDTPPDHPIHYHLMYLSNFRGDDLRIRPFHRVVNIPAGTEVSRFWSLARQYFILEPARNRQPVFEEMQQRPNQVGFVVEGRLFFATLRPELNANAVIDLPLPAVVKSLSYTQLHYLVLDRILGYPYQEQPRSPDIQYYNSLGRAVLEADKGSSKLAFLMPEVTPQQMMEVCLAGAVMPQKSTFFFPKVQGGFLYAFLNRDE